MIATVEPEKAEAVIKALKKENIPASIIGEVLPKDKGIVIIDGDKKYQLWTTILMDVIKYLEKLRI